MSKRQRQGFYVYMAPEGGDGGTGGTGGTGEGTGTTSSVLTGGKEGAPSGQDWRTGLPDDLRAHPALTDIKDLNGLAKSYVHAQSLVGADKIVLPKTDASPQEMNEFWNKLGRPSVADDYKFPDLKDTGLEKNEEDQKWAKGLFHELGLTQTQSEKLYAAYTTRLGGGVKAMQEAKEQAQNAGLEELRAEWKGETFDLNIQMAQKALNTFGDEKLKAHLNATGLGNDPMLIRTFAKIGKLLGEDRAFGERTSGAGFASGPEAAKAEIANLQLNKDFQKAYLTASDPGHALALDKMTKLFAIAYPGKVLS